MTTYKLEKSNRKNKKYKISSDEPKRTIHFGAKGYEDYTIHRDKQRKKMYIKRHKKREDWTDIDTAGFWARYILWNKLSLEESVNDVQKKFDINIEMNI